MEIKQPVWGPPVSKKAPFSRGLVVLLNTDTLVLTGWTAEQRLVSEEKGWWGRELPDHRGAQLREWGKQGGELPGYRGTWWDTHICTFPQDMYTQCNPTLTPLLPDSVGGGGVVRAHPSDCHHHWQWQWGKSLPTLGFCAALLPAAADTSITQICCWAAKAKCRERGGRGVGVCCSYAGCMCIHELQSQQAGQAQSSLSAPNHSPAPQPSTGRSDLCMLQRILTLNLEVRAACANFVYSVE